MKVLAKLAVGDETVGADEVVRFVGGSKGAMLLTNTLDNATDKQSTILAPNYNSSTNELATVLTHNSSAGGFTTNIITIGGGISTYDSADIIFFNTGGVGELNGTARVRIDDNGLQMQNSANLLLQQDPTSALHAATKQYAEARANHTGTQLASTISDFAEATSDQVGTMVTGNTESGITVTYDDADNTLDFTVTDSPLLGGQNSAYHLSRSNHTGTQLASTISDFEEATEDVVGGMVISNTETGITVTYDDTDGTLDFVVAYGTPGTIQPDHTASAGTANTAARSDHRHAIVAAAPSATLTLGSSNAEGSSTSFARADHTHAFDKAEDIDIQGLDANGTNQAGLNNEFAAAGHIHAVNTSDGTVSTLSVTSTSANGSASGLARRDHSHAITTTSNGSSNPSTILAADGSGNLTLGTLTVAGLDDTGAGTISLNSNRLTSVTDPSGAQDAATKAYVDGVASGLDLKKSVRAATTTNNTLLSTQTVDGVALSIGDRVLVKDQNTASQNGIYVVQSGSWTRASDFDQNAEVTAGAFTFVEEGTTNGDSGWVLTTNDTITVGITSMSFAQFSGAGQITAGDGLGKTGNTLFVNAGDGIDILSDNVRVLASDIAGTGIVAVSNNLDIVYSSNSTANIDASTSVSADGSFNEAARSNHVHGVTTAAPTTDLSATTTNSAGSGIAFVHSNHTHALDVTGTPASLTASTTNSNGSSSGLARTNHTHALDVAGTPGTLTQSSTNSNGSGAPLARANHTHAITSTSDGKTNTSTILASDANGDLTISQLNVDDVDFTTQSTRPSGATVGSVYYDSGAGSFEAGLWIYDGTEWHPFWQTPVRARVKRGNSQSISHNTFTTITWVGGDTAYEDGGTLVDATNDQLVVPTGRPGWYVAGGSIQYDVADYNRAFIYIDTSFETSGDPEYAFAELSADNGTGSGIAGIGATVIGPPVYMSGGEWFRLRTYHFGSSAAQDVINAQLWLYRLPQWGTQ